MHRHIWKIESKVTQQSAWEMMNTGAQVTNLDRGSVKLFIQPVVVTYQCAVCGEQKVERV